MLALVKLDHYIPYIILLLLLITISEIEASCDRVFLSNTDSSIKTFEAPNRLSLKPFKVTVNGPGNVTLSTNTTENDYKPMHCVYKFIANEGERVALNFSSFRLRGDEPECTREYVDIYIKLKSEDNLETVLGFERPNGRFCTTVMPRRLVSLHNVLVLIIYSELKPPAKARPLFTGTYEFSKSKLAEQLNPSEDNSLCTHTIYSTDKREGEFQSITYPGVYAKGLKCSYRFIGESGQRLRLEFLDLDLYYGGSHCPLDSVKVFDGLEETDPIINTICGSHRSLIIFSTKENLLITFNTLEREIEVQNRGFSAYFEFSDTFVDPSFINGPYARHIRGSECDQRVISNKATSGTVVSPDPKHHLNAICRYIFEGLQTSTDYEKVSLKFSEFDLKTAHTLAASKSIMATTTTTTTTASPLPPLLPNLSITPIIFNQSFNNQELGPSSTNTSVEQCPDNYVRLYTAEQKSDQKQDPNDYDYVFCSNEIPSIIESDAASLFMEYNSGSIGGFFKAEYSFIVDFRVPGLQASTSCDYIYRSEYQKSETFNSPRHPSWYISDRNCSYTFMTKPNEALLIQFNTFKMFNTFEEKVAGYNDVCKGEDLVEIYELTLDSSEQRIVDLSEIGIYCGMTTPGPILSYRPVRINFRTNKEQVHYGFSALYNFFPIEGLKTNEFVTNCGSHIFANQRFRSGVIASPETYRPETYEKRNHICTWNITARVSYKIALNFNKFEVEGSPNVRGCNTASVRLTTGRNKLPTELCGTISPSNGSIHQYVSDNEWLSVTFISTKSASGSNGFAATWSEIKRA